MNNLVETVEKAFASDPDGAAIMIDEAIQNYALDLIEDNYDMVNSALAHEFQRRTNVAKAAIGRQYVETISKGIYPSDELQQTAQWLAGLDAFIGEVSKGLRLETWLFGNEEKQRNVSRDAQGRFTKYVDPYSTKTAVTAPEDKLSPALNGSLVLRDANGGRVLSDAAKENQLAINRHQSQWESANEHAKDLHSLFDGDTKGVKVVINRLENGKEVAPVMFDLRDAKNGIPAVNALEINPADQTIVSVGVSVDETASEATKNRVARFNLGGLAGSEGLAGLERGMDQWGSAFGRRGIEQKKTDRFFERMTGASNVLSAAGSTKAAAFTKLVGTMGPEAEKVLGPYVRQSAYRYRGTEKSPDKSLLEEFNSADMKAVRSGSASPESVERGAGIVANSYAVRSKDAAGDQLKLEVQSDVAVANLYRTLPKDPFTARLSEKAGHILPSQGVIIGADGKVVTQAVGYADDHYLPFDLKNMAQLRGGQYVRTRVSGGLTGEDIYAAVQSGARMVTVVSTSGVFSLELDPNFRGARGNSDKARQMYERYLKILDAVDGSNMYLKDVSSKEHDEAERTARMMVAGEPNTADTRRRMKEIRDSILDQKRYDQKSGIDTEALQTQAEEVARKDPDYSRLSNAAQARRVQDVYDELKFSAQGEAVQELSLNAAGYDVALKTLQEQFPYFIRRTSYSPLSTGRTGKEGEGFLSARGVDDRLGTVLQSSGRNDRGYVLPGELRPAKTSEGYYLRGNGMKSRKTTEERSENQGGETPGAASDAGETVPAGGDTSPASTSDKPAVGGPLLTRLALYEDTTKSEISEALASFRAPLESVQARTSSGGAKSWEEAKQSKNTTEMAQNLLTNLSSLEERLNDPEAARALGDQKAVVSAFKAVYGDGFFDLLADPSFAAAFGNATTVDAAAKHVSDLATYVSDRLALRRPFKEGSSDPFAVSNMPQAFSNLMALDNRQKLDHFLSGSEGQQLAKVADQLGNNPKDSVPKLVESLKLLNKNRNAAFSETTDKGNITEFAERLAKLSNLGDKETGIANLKIVLGTDTIQPSAWSPDALNRRAMQLQQAWSLIQVQKLIDILDGDRDGGSPKVTLPPQSGVGKSLALSFRQVEVLPRNHKTAVTVLLNKAAGRPLLKGL